ncbi:2'-5' RNA ligase family protein [Clostridium chromiireducens]|uniref:2'-5' RNA ligase family protein n=1 Tax=Clostridium chromiireducens TaxID=225345 RepID=A0A964RML1_9CLOT|nr:2'-5' RNA ligase family protein [Clostridium chromiireducens]MVX64426.1 2'-5' RNA ligase family protein [Clostridium chromiireducens]
MRYVIVCVVKGIAGDFNNNLRKELFEKFKAKSSKLPAHFTIKAPFEYEGEITELEKVLEEFCEKEVAEEFTIDGYDYFDDRVIYMRVNMSKQAKNIHDKLIDKMREVSYIEFDKKDGKNKIFHVTLASKNLRPIYNKVWEHIQLYSCNFQCPFDNITVYNWKEGTWKLYKEFRLKDA